jgi:hypothetical protein
MSVCGTLDDQAAGYVVAPDMTRSIGGRGSQIGLMIVSRKGERR